MGNPCNRYINPYYWADDHPLLYGYNYSLDPSTYIQVGHLFFWEWISNFWILEVKNVCVNMDFLLAHIVSIMWIVVTHNNHQQSNDSETHRVFKKFLCMISMGFFWGLHNFTKLNNLASHLPEIWRGLKSKAFASGDLVVRKFVPLFVQRIWDWKFRHINADVCGLRPEDVANFRWERSFEPGFGPWRFATQGRQPVFCRFESS